MNLALSDFLSWYQLFFSTSFTGNNNEITFLLEMYKTEIANFIPLKESKIKNYKFESCSQFYLAIPIWQDFTVKAFEKGDNTNLLTLTSDVDFTSQKSVIDSNKTIGLDFSCLRCNCECEIIQISGTFGYELPNNLIKIIFRLLSNFSPAENKQVCCQDECSNKILTKIIVGDVSKTYEVNKEKQYELQNLKNGYGIIKYQPVLNILNKYKNELIVL